MTVESQYAHSVVFGGWLDNDEVLGASDGVCASCPLVKIRNLDVDFNFNLPSNAVIDKVEVRVKGCCDKASGERLQFHVWEDDVATWWGIARVNIQGLNCAATAWTTWKDITAKSPLGWSYSDINNIKVRLEHRPAGSPPPDLLPWTSYGDAVELRVTYHLVSGGPRAAFFLGKPYVFDMTPYYYVAYRTIRKG